VINILVNIKEIPYRDVSKLNPTVKLKRKLAAIPRKA
jgi:hypothetical protein